MNFEVVHFVSAADDMEEKVYDPRDMFGEIGLLIMEARTPDLSPKGRIEGPHCSTLIGSTDHECDRHKEKVSSVHVSRFDHFFKKGR